MKNKASVFLKQIVSLLSSIAKAKTLAIKSKTNAAKARLIMFSLVRNKKVYLDNISNKIHNFLLGHHGKDNQDEEFDESKAIVLYNNNVMANNSTMVYNDHYDYYNDNDDDKYPDLRHCLFEEEDFMEGGGGSVIDMVKNSREEEGENFRLEDEIDHVADLFIKKFHKQIRMQKLLSFKKHQDMLNRGA